MTFIKSLQRWPAWLLVSFVLAVFLFFSLAHIRRPLGQEDLHWFGPAKSLYLTGSPRTYNEPDVVWVDHPHLYLRCITGAFRLFGISEVSARLPGILAGVISTFLVFFLIKGFSPDRERSTVWAALWALQYALIPAVSVGSNYVMHDNTVLVPAIILLYYAFARFSIEGTWAWAIALATMAALSLWIRISTPVAVLFLLAILTPTYIKGGKRQWWCIATLAAGIALFLLSWDLYCDFTGFPFAKPISYTLGAILSKTHLAGTSKVPDLQSLIYLLLWLGPFSVFLFILAAARRVSEFWRERTPRVEDLFCAGAILLMVGYTVAGDAIFGFPRYQSPAFPLICIFAGLALCRWDALPEELNFGPIAGVALAAFAIQLGILRDVIFLIRYTLRLEAVGPTGFHPAINTLVCRGLAFCAAHGILALVCLRSSFKGRLLSFLFCLSFGANLGTCWLQRFAPYYVGYNYGGLGTVAAACYIAAQVPPYGVVLAPDEVLFYTGEYESKYGYTPHPLWLDKDALRRKLADRDTMGFAYSIITNTVEQVRICRDDPEIARILARDYSPKDIGSYTIWIRKRSSAATLVPLSAGRPAGSGLRRGRTG
jgi:4-amino-4-deoxy-L-arabinose transferase-like glycosyltransferase